MVKKLLRLCAAAFCLALFAMPAVARHHCPDYLVWEDVSCTHVAGTSCEDCTYYCQDLNFKRRFWGRWDVCEGGGGGPEPN